MTRSVPIAVNMLAVSLLAAMVAAQAQEAPPAGGALSKDVGVQVDVGPPALPAAPPAGGVDERALRYYASHYDYAHVDQEIARLKALHPDWEPPRDLFGGPGRAGPEVDVSGLWAAYDRNDFAEVRREMTALQRINPGWEPPKKLVDLMAAAELRQALKQAALHKDWNAAVAAAAPHPELIATTPELIENLWLLAEAQFRRGEKDQAYALYRRAWDDPEVSADLRLSTLQKALANRDDGRLRELFALEQKRSRSDAQNARFAQIEKDWRGGGGNGGPPGERARLGMALAKVSSGKVEAADLDWVQRTTETYRDANAAQVLGWYYFDRKAFDQAETWFGRSMSWQASPAAAEGLARTYMQQHRLEEARALVHAWQDRAPRLAAVAADLDRQRVWDDSQGGDPRERLQLSGQLLAHATKPDAGLLVARGWALYQLDRAGEAVQAFQRALTAAGAGGSARGDAVYGLGHAYVAAGFAGEAEKLLADPALSAEQHKRLEQVVARRQALDAYDDGRYEESLQRIRMVRQNDPNDSSLAALEAWNLLELGQYSQANALFAQLYQTYQSPDAQAGLNILQGRQYPQR